MAKKIAIVLAGCGVKDGSEIHESVLSLLAVVRSGAEPSFFAPNLLQQTVTNHLNGEPMPEQRNMLVEAARIARGAVSDITALKAADFDAVLFPGGFGSALNLSDFARKGADCTVIPEVERVIKEFHGSGKPIGVICIAPTMAARVLGGEGIELTIGTDPQTAEKVEAMGAKHVSKKVTEIHIDQKNKIVSTPAYMLARNIAEVETGISKLVEAVVDLAGN